MKKNYLKRITGFICVALIVLALSACGSSSSQGASNSSKVKVTKSQSEFIEKRVLGFLNSSDNPLQNSYRTHQYTVDSLQQNESESRAIILLEEESKKSHCDVTLTIFWVENSDAVATRVTEISSYPLQAPDEADEKNLIEQLSTRYSFSSPIIKVDCSAWESSSSSFICTGTIEQAYEMFIESREDSYNVHWNLSREQWELDDRIDNISHTYDFSPINGVWEAVFTHNTAILLADDIKYTYTFSNAGTIFEKSGAYTTTTVDVDHGLNELWDSNVNMDLPANADSYFETGTMDIKQVPGNGFEIEFYQHTGDYLNPYLIHIYQEKITLDGWTCRDCNLTRSEWADNSSIASNSMPVIEQTQNSQTEFTQHVDSSTDSGTASPFNDVQVPETTSFATQDSQTTETLADVNDITASAFTGSIADYRTVYFYEAVASSELIEDNTLFKADFAINRDLYYPWVEGVEGNGIGESITMMFKKPETFQLLGFQIGYAATRQQFEKNNRPRAVHISFSDGTGFDYTFDDTRDEQYVLLSSPITSESVTLTILDVYPGTEYADTCLYMVRAFA